MSAIILLSTVVTAVEHLPELRYDLHLDSPSLLHVSAQYAAWIVGTVFGCMFTASSSLVPIAKTSKASSDDNSSSDPAINPANLDSCSFQQMISLHFI